MSGKGPIVVIVFSLLVVVLMGLTSLLPTVVAVESELEFETNQEKVKSHLSTSDNWKNWLFSKQSSEMKFIQNGPVKGVGSGFKWFSDVEGDGALNIVAVAANSVRYELVTDNGQFRNRGQFLLEETTIGTKVKWLDTLDVSTSFFARIAANDDHFGDRIKVKNKEVLVMINKVLIQE